MPLPWPAGRRRTHSQRHRAGHSRSPGWHVPPLRLSPLAGPGNSYWLAAPSHPCRRLRCPPAVLCRAAQSPPFFREVRIDPRAEPGFFLAPLETLIDQDLADAATAHADALFAQIGDHAVERPAGKWQAQFGGARQSGANDHALLLRRIGRWSPRAHVLLQALQAALVEALEPEPDSCAAQPHPRGDLWRTQPFLDSMQDDLRAPHQTRATLARACQVRQLAGLFRAESPDVDGHARVPRWDGVVP